MGDRLTFGCQDVSELLSAPYSRAVVSVYFVVMTCALEQWS